jgi:hypothetical protein
MRTVRQWMWTAVAVGMTMLASGGVALAQPAAQAPAASRPYAVEYYYKVKWGHFDEFMELYRRNHYPILLREQALGRILRMEAAFPRNHAGEANRWDMRFTIVWKDVTMTADAFDTSGIIKELYPDQAKFKAEEQRRFEILVEHIDVPVRVDDLSGWTR